MPKEIHFEMVVFPWSYEFWGVYTKYVGGGGDLI